MREFLPLQTPILMVSATYPLSEDSVPSYIEELAAFMAERAGAGEGLGGSKKEVQSHSWKDEVTVLTLEELLPMSFGPDELAAGQK